MIQTVIRPSLQNRAFFTRIPSKFVYKCRPKTVHQNKNHTSFDTWYCNGLKIQMRNLFSENLIFLLTF